MKTFTITSQPFYEQYNQCYKNILTINTEPQGPLKQYVRKINFPPLSPFQREGPCNPIPRCGLAIYNLNHFSCNIMTPNEIPELISFLQQNGYCIETQLTNMLNQSNIKLSNKSLVFNVTYYGENQPNFVYIR
jgi:hypothetical protein